MIVTLHREFRFEASHQLTHLPPEHPCHNLHGHSYGVRVEVHGEVDPATGFLIDYADIDRAVQPNIDILDHTHLNDIPDLTMATTEYIARWLWERLRPALPMLSAISVSETNASGCEYRGE